MLEKKQVSKILDTMKERFPKADTTLEKTDPFHFLLSIILSAQATDVSVNKATPALFKAYATPADLAQADPSEVEKYIKRSDCITIRPSIWSGAQKIWSNVSMAKFQRRAKS